MFAIDRRVLAKLEPTVRRVLIVDPNPHSAKLLTDIMKGLGSKDVAVEIDEARALRMAASLEPSMVFTEYAGPGLSGEAFAKALRRSNLGCRRAPIIMATAEATASTIKGARDAGVHEFLRKPFTSADLFKRVENVALKPRDWIEGIAYVGPDRRRFNSGEYVGPAKRKNDAATPEESVASIRDQAMRILAAALDQFDNDPMQATRAVREQASTLKKLALKASDSRLAVAVGALEVSMAAGAPTKATLYPPITALLEIYPIEQLKRAS
ncbi:MAG: response regulator [Brevundimonas sp.]|nr:MAG: response regulator [Brevundimonas sp.]